MGLKVGRIQLTVTDKPLHSQVAQLGIYSMEKERSGIRKKNKMGKEKGKEKRKDKNTDFFF